MRYVTVETIAAHYLTKLTTVQPTRPYVLGGYSFGAVVAFEMATQLLARGEDVSLLALLCPGIPTGGGRRREKRQGSPAHVGSVLTSGHRLRRGLAGLRPSDKVRYIGTSLRSRLTGRIEPVAKAEASRMLAAMGFPVPPGMRSSYILRIYFQVLARYMAGRYHGPAILFVGKDCPEQERY